MKLDNSNVASLDGIRGYSILLVFFSHIGFGNIVPGGLGVTIFFFISGFLITKLLLFEIKKTQTVNFKAFYLRRIFRLYPALVFFLALVLLLFIIVDRPIQSGELTAAIFYYVNYAWVFFKPSEVDKWHGIFKILWSLSIEEHFYLIFPLVLFILRRRTTLFYFFCFITLFTCLLFRLYYAENLGSYELIEAYNYSLTHTRMDSILYGCLIAFVLYNKNGDKFLVLLKNNILFVSAIVLLIFTIVYRDPIFRQTYRYSLQGIALSVLIVNVIFSTRPIMNYIFSNKGIIYIGRLSYSIYLFHWLSLYISDLFFNGYTIGWYMLVITLTIFISLISYHFIELPFVKLRKSYGSNVK